AEISKVMERPAFGGGELYVAERDPDGHRRTLRNPLHYVDTDWGRYLNHRVRTGDEEEFRVQPADAATLAATLESLRSHLTVAQHVCTVTGRGEPGRNTPPPRPPTRSTTPRHPASGSTPSPPPDPPRRR